MLLRELLPTTVMHCSRYTAVYAHMLHCQKAAACTVGGFTVSGLLSPPNATSCHWTKDCQYYFLNQRSLLTTRYYCYHDMMICLTACLSYIFRWMRGKDSVTTYLNQRYPRLVSACSGVLGGGMLPRVSSSTAADDRDRSSVHRNRYPCFALQVTCDPSEYDVVLEPDRSYAVFKDEASLMRCVEVMLLAMIEEHAPVERKADLVRAVREASTIAPPHGVQQIRWSAICSMTTPARATTTTMTMTIPTSSACPRLLPCPHRRDHSQWATSLPVLVVGVPSMLRGLCLCVRL